MCGLDKFLKSAALRSYHTQVDCNLDSKKCLDMTPWFTGVSSPTRHAGIQATEDNVVGLIQELISNFKMPVGNCSLANYKNEMNQNLNVSFKVTQYLIRLLYAYFNGIIIPSRPTWSTSFLSLCLHLYKCTVP